MTLEDCKKNALNYIQRSEWKKNQKNMYQIAVRNKWLDQCCSHMIVIKKPNGYWTLEKCKIDALNYVSRKEWQIKSMAAYSRARKNKWLDQCCSHMIKLGSIYKRLIYVFEFPDKSVYVGLTCNSEKRKNNHLLHEIKRKKSSVYKYIQLTGLKPLFKILTEYIPLELAILKESEFVEKYRLENWRILNKTKTGGLGGGIIKWTKENCFNDALKYSYKKEWKNKSSSAYDAARRNLWIDECCKHMKRPPSWNKK